MNPVVKLHGMVLTSWKNLEVFLNKKGKAMLRFGLGLVFNFNKFMHSGMELSIGYRDLPTSIECSSLALSLLLPISVSPQRQ